MSVAVRRGATLVELMIAVTLFAVVMSAAVGVVARQWRLHAALDARRDAHEQLVAGAHVLSAALRTTAGDGGALDPSDLLVVTDTLLELHTPTGASIVCSVVDPRTVELAPESRVRPGLTSWIAEPRPGDMARFLGDATTDRWHAASVDSVGHRAAGCAGSPLARAAEQAVPRVRLRLTSPLPSDVMAGAPVRLARRTRYLLYRAGDGRWYLGQREWDGTSWSGTQPAAGPLRRPGVRGGMSLVARDSTGAAISPASVATTRVRWIDLVLRADVPVAGGARGIMTLDTVWRRIAPRNGG